MAKTVISRNFRYPSAELRDKVRRAVKVRGFRSEQAFLIAACERELRESDSAEATAQLEARIAATLANTGKQVQSLFTLVHAQFALTNSLLQYVLTCVVEPPEDVLPAARARAKARYAKILRLAGQEVATRNQATLEEVLSHGKQH
jgi:ABC-type histidine transport system ATPase subunit